MQIIQSLDLGDRVNLALAYKCFDDILKSNPFKKKIWLYEPYELTLHDQKYQIDTNLAIEYDLYKSLLRYQQMWFGCTEFRRTNERFELDQALPNRYSTKLGEFMGIIFHVNNNIRVTRSTSILFDQFILAYPSWQKSIEFISCRYVFSNWLLSTSLDDHPLRVRNFEPKKMSLLKYHTRHFIRHREICSRNHEYQHCSMYLKYAGIIPKLVIGFFDDDNW